MVDGQNQKFNLCQNTQNNLCKAMHQWVHTCRISVLMIVSKIVTYIISHMHIIKGGVPLLYCELNEWILITFFQNTFWFSSFKWDIRKWLLLGYYLGPQPGRYHLLSGLCALLYDSNISLCLDTECNSTPHKCHTHLSWQYGLVIWNHKFRATQNNDPFPQIS
jgi:hypothetical protein